MLDNNDPVAKLEAKNLLQAAFPNRKFLANPNETGVTFLGLSGAPNVEVERRRTWKKGNFPFKTILVQTKKINLSQDDKNKFVIFSDDLTHAIVLDAKTVRESNAKDSNVEKCRHFVKDGEWQENTLFVEQLNKRVANRINVDLFEDPSIKEFI